MGHHCDYYRYAQGIGSRGGWFGCNRCSGVLLHLANAQRAANEIARLNDIYLKLMEEYYVGTECCSQWDSLAGDACTRTNIYFDCIRNYVPSRECHQFSVHHAYPSGTPTDSKGDA